MTTHYFDIAGELSFLVSNGGREVGDKQETRLWQTKKIK